MTTYTIISDSEIDAESYLIESLFQRLRDNPIAITEGASGAPQTQAGCYEPGSITNAYLRTGIIDFNKVASGELTETHMDSTAQSYLTTNGASHDHVGGDGATLDATSFKSSEHVYMSTVVKQSIQGSGVVVSVGAGVRTVFGFPGYAMLSRIGTTNTIDLQLYILSGTYTGWQGVAYPKGLIKFDAGSVALYNPGSASHDEAYFYINL